VQACVGITNLFERELREAALENVEALVMRHAMLVKALKDKLIEFG
jgi:hypothetical protein